MASKNKNEEMTEIFTEAINNLEKWNSVELSTERIKMALNNTYAKQVERIEELVESELK